MKLSKKLSLHLKKTGQSTTEYMVLMVVVMGSLLAMGVYFKRALQGHVIGTQTEFGMSRAVSTSGDSGGKGMGWGLYDPRTTSGHVQHSLRSVTNSITRTRDVGGRYETTRDDVTNSLEWTTGTIESGGY